VRKGPRVVASWVKGGKAASDGEKKSRRFNQVDRVQGEGQREKNGKGARLKKKICTSVVVPEEKGGDLQRRFCKKWMEEKAPGLPWGGKTAEAGFRKERGKGVHRCEQGGSSRPRSEKKKKKESAP